MCTIVDLEATKYAKRKEVCSAWRVHRIVDKGTNNEQRRSPWQYALIQSENMVDVVFVGARQGRIIDAGAFHCARTRKAARLLKKWLIGTHPYTLNFVVEKVFFKPQDIVAVGRNSTFSKRAFGMENEKNENICVSRFVLNEKDK